MTRWGGITQRTHTLPKHMRREQAGQGRQGQAKPGQAKPGQAKAASEERNLDQPGQTNARPDAPIYALWPAPAAIDNPIASVMAEASSESPMSSSAAIAAAAAAIAVAAAAAAAAAAASDPMGCFASPPPGVFCFPTGVPRPPHWGGAATPLGRWPPHWQTASGVAPPLWQRRVGWTLPQRTRPCAAILREDLPMCCRARRDASLTPSPLRRTRHSTYARPTPPTAQRGPPHTVGLSASAWTFMTVGCDVTVKNTSVSANFSTLRAMIHHPALQGLSANRAWVCSDPAGQPASASQGQVDGPYQGVDPGLEAFRPSLTSFGRSLGLSRRE